MVSGDDGGNKEPCTGEYLENSEMGVFGVYLMKWQKVSN